MIHHQSHLPLQELNSWENLKPIECSKLENGIDFVLVTRAAFSDKDDGLESRNFSSIDENVTQIQLNTTLQIESNHTHTHTHIGGGGGEGEVINIKNTNSE